MPAARAIRDDVHGVVCRATRGMQAHNAIDDGAFVYHLASRLNSFARPVIESARLTASRVRASRSGVPGLTKRHRAYGSHDFHQHLVGIGRAIEGAGARSMIGLGFRSPEARHGPPCLLHKCWRMRDFSSFGRPRCHRSPRRMNTAGRWAEGQRCNRQTRHDLVTRYRYILGGIEHIMRQAYTCRHGNGIAGNTAKAPCPADLALHHRTWPERPLPPAPRPLLHGLLRE